MRQVSASTAVFATKINRSPLRLSEDSFGSILGDIVVLLWPPPNTAAQVAAVVSCSVRNVELCLSGRQKWSGDAVAAIVAEVLRRHHMRNVKILPRE